jgi:MoaA/NifB/PqqE/SkfB family radical SAM enzyme
MDVGLFHKLIDKIVNDCQARREGFEVYLYNWGEPTLHPQINEICDILSARRIVFYISSNMNTEMSFAHLVKANRLRISLSGFTNDVYQKSHVGGDVNLVISNMYRLRHTIDRYKSKLHVEVNYHIYRDNCDDRMITLARLSRELGYELSFAYAKLGPIEKLIDYMEGSPRFTDRDRETMRRMLLPIEETLTVAKRAGHRDCSLRAEQTCINYDGSVAVCCGVFDPINNAADSFLDVSHGDLRQRKLEMSICTRCMQLGIHTSALYLPNDLWEDVVMKKQVAARQKYVTRMFSQPQILEVIYSGAREVVI